jgi:uncharacterized protein DUF4926
MTSGVKWKSRTADNGNTIERGKSNELEIHNLVALLEDIPEQKLERGDVGPVVKCDMPDDLCEVRFGWSYRHGMISITLHSHSLLPLNQAYYEELSLYAPLADHTEYEKKRLENIQAV